MSPNLRELLSSVRVWRRAFTAAVLVTLTAPVGASAAGWVGPAPLPGSGPDVGYEQVIVEADGDAYAAWTAKDAGFSRVYVARRPVATGAWQAPEPVSPAGEEAVGPRVGVDGAGNITAVWYRSPDNAVFSSERPVSGTWSAPATLGTPGAEPAVAVNASGAAVAAWREFGPADERAMVVTRSGPSGAWSAPTSLTGAGVDALFVKVALDDAGNAVVAWQARAPGLSIEASSRPASSGVWGAPPTTLSGALEGTDPSLGMDAAGNATVIFNGFDTATMTASIQSATKPVGGAWGAHTPIRESNDIASVAPPVLAVHPTGRMIALWSEIAPTTRLRSSSRTAAADPWGADGDVREVADIPRCCGVAMTATGNVTVLTAINGVIEAQQRVGDAGSWGPVATLGTDYFNTAPIAGGDDAGHVLGLWLRNGGQADSDLVVSTFDVSAPIVDNVTLPAQVTAGQSAAMSATARDLWTSVAEIRWTFGDGTAPALGAATSHTWSNPGVFTVTVRVTDAAGNVTQTTRTVTVVAPVPVVNAAARVVGSPILGTRVSCKAEVSNTTASSVSWRRGTKVIATTATYRIAKADLGKRIRCVLTATGAGGTVTTASPPRTIPARCVVPATRGLKVAVARTRLADRGCRSRVVRVIGTGVARTRVLGTVPGRGTSIANGATVTVRVRR